MTDLWLSDVFSFFFSCLNQMLGVYGTSISGFQATRLNINHSEDQPVQDVDNQESPNPLFFIAMICLKKEQVKSSGIY
jgi:hypothetical protein